MKKAILILMLSASGAFGQSYTVERNGIYTTNN
jgi:hypothetical protein